MRKTIFLVVLVLVLFLVGGGFCNPVFASQNEVKSESVDLGEISPLIKNTGQEDESILFYSDNNWGRLSIRKNDIVFQIKVEENEKTFSIKNIYLEFPQNLEEKIGGFGEPISQLNYFIGNDPSNWHTEIPVYDSVFIENFYQGNNLVISSSRSFKPFISGVNEDQLKHLIKVKSNIPCGIKDGSLIAEIKDRSFVLNFFNDRVTNQRNESQSLVWSTFLGGSKKDVAYQIVLDSLKNVYIAGSSESADIPTPNGYDQSQNSSSWSDIYVAKLSSTGNQLVWGTYIGGDTTDKAYSLAIDSEGNVLVGGQGTKNIPTPNGYLTSLPSDSATAMYLAKLSPSGSSLLWGTFIAGGQCGKLALDSSNNVVFVAETSKSTAPCPNGYDQTYNGGSSDLYIGKLSSQGNSLLWGTYLGGSNDDALDDDYYEGNHLDVKFSRDGNIIVGTTTKSSNIPTPNGYDTSINGLWDIYIAKLSSDGRNLLWGTYLGGSNDDKLGEINFDQSGNIVITGSTRSTDIPVKNGYQMTHNAGYDGYVAKLSSDGSSLIWGTQLGGSRDDSLYSCDLDSEDNVILAGWTESSDMPVKNAYDNTWNTTIGGPDIYFAILKSDGSDLLEGSFLGGKYDEIAFSVVFDNIDSILLGGKTCSDDIPAINGFDSTLNNPTCGNYGTYDIYLAKFNVSSLVGCSMTCTASVPNYSKPNESVNFTSSVTVDPPNCTNPSYDWDFGDGSAHSTTQNATHTYTAEKSYTWKLTVSGSEVPPCIKSGTITVTSSNCRLTCSASSPTSGVKNFPVQFTATSTPQDCTSSVTYLWDFGDGQSSTSQNPSHTYTNAGTYNWTMTAKADSITCQKTGTISILAERPCLTVGSVKFCADSINQNGSNYILSGNVTAGDVLYFTQDVTYTKIASTSGNIVTNGDIYVPNVQGKDETLIKGPGITYLVDGNSASFAPSYEPLLYALRLAGLPLSVGGTNMTLESGGVKITPFIDIGSGSLTIARLQVEILIVPNGQKKLLYFQLVAMETPCPSISIASIDINYNPLTDTITGSVSAGFPFLDTPSIEATITFVSGCFDGFTVTVELAEGIPLGTTGLEIDAFTMEVANLCDLPKFYIFLGGNLAIEGVPSEVLALQHLGLGYQVPFTLQIDGGTLSFLGYPLGSSGGTIRVYPPYISAYGHTNIATVYTADVSLTLDISNLVISGSTYGSFLVPDWSCGCCNITCINGCFCRAVKCAVRKILGKLPYTVAGAGMTVSIGQVKSGEWGGDLKGMLTVANKSIAADISFLNGDVSVSVGENYDDLFQIWQREERVLSPLGYEKILTLPASEEDVTFSASSASTIPEIYVVTPTGERLTKDNYTTYPGVAYYESSEDSTSAFEVTPAAAGMWTLGETNLDSDSVGLFALGIHPKPQVTFGSVAPNSTGYSINFSVAPASEDTKVSVYYSDSPDYGNGLLIEDNLTSSDGNFSVDWDTSNIATGNYLVFVKADDGKNPDESFYYQNQLVVNKNVVAPPTNLTGLRTQESATLNWTPSTSENVAGYMLLYTDEPDVYGYKYRLSAVLSDTITVSELKLDKTYKFAVIAYDKDGNYSLESNSIKLANTPPPVITSMAKLGSPFRINVSGSNLQQGIKVKINGNLWSNVKWLSTSNIKIKGGSSLKSLVPKGVDTTFTFINPDGGETTVSWKY